MAPARQDVAWGDPFALACGASAAVQAGDRIFLSGFPAQGASAGEAFREALGRLDNALATLGVPRADVVRTRLFFTRPDDYAPLGVAHGTAFGAIRPALSLTQVHFLPGAAGDPQPGARVVLEAEAVRGAAGRKRSWALDLPHGADWGSSGAVRVGDEVWIAGAPALRADGAVAFPGDVLAQTRAVVARVLGAVAAAGGGPGDVVATRHYTAVAYLGSDTSAARRPLMHPHHPTSAGITVQGVGPRPAGILVEAEAVIGAAGGRRNRTTGRPSEEEHHYSRSVRWGDVVYVSGTTSVQLDEEVGAPFDAYAQTRQALEWIRWGIERQGLSLDDVVRTRSYVVGEEHTEAVARGLREALSRGRPAATVVGVPALGRPSILVEIEATAVAP